MKKGPLKRHLFFMGLVLVCFFCLLSHFLANDDFLREAIFKLHAGQDLGKEIRTAILAYGAEAPLLFMGLQILQVILAPIPGEVSGFLGGYIFGAWPGFFYSSIGLTMGSWIAFGIGRIIWDLMPERLMETRIYQRFSTLVGKGQFIIPFILFLIPGIPKDSLSYLLGFSRMPLVVFLFIAGVGRMPGTLMLSFQGADVFAANYLRLLVILAISIAISLPCFYYRRNILAMLLRHTRRKNNAN